jgi:hypothetical protein
VFKHIEFPGHIPHRAFVVLAIEAGDEKKIRLLGVRGLQVSEKLCEFHREGFVPFPEHQHNQQLI